MDFSSLPFIKSFAKSHQIIKLKQNLFFLLICFNGRIKFFFFVPKLPDLSNNIFFSFDEGGNSDCYGIIITFRHL